MCTVQYISSVTIIKFNCTIIAENYKNISEMYLSLNIMRWSDIVERDQSYHISFSGFIGLSLITGPDPELMKNRSPKALGGCGRSAQDAHSSMAPNLTSKFLEGFCLLYYCFAFFLWTFKFGFEHCLFSSHISSHNSFIKIVNSYALSRTAFFNS